MAETEVSLCVHAKIFFTDFHLQQFSGPRRETEQAARQTLAPELQKLNPLLGAYAVLQGWLVDLINKFGTLNGFQMLHDRFMSGQALNVQIIAALIK